MFGIQASSVRTLSLTRLQKQKGSTVLLYAYHMILDLVLKNGYLMIVKIRKDKDRE